MNTLSTSFLILRNVDFVAKYFPFFLQTSLRASFSLQISHPTDIAFFYNTLKKTKGMNTNTAFSAEEDSNSNNQRGNDIHTPRILDVLNQKDSVYGSEYRSAHIEYFQALLDGVSIKKENLVYTAFAPVKKWLFNDLSFVFTKRELKELKSLEVPHLFESEEGYESKIDLKIYGFKYYNLEFLILFSQEIVQYLESLFEMDIPFDHVIIIVSDQNTKIESLGNILIINDLEISRMSSSPNSLIYASLTISLFYARIYFGNIVSYVSPEEKFIVEGIRGTLALIFLQNSVNLDRELNHILNQRTKFEKMVKVDESKEQSSTEDQVSATMNHEESETQSIRSSQASLSSRAFKKAPQFLNESLLSNKSQDSATKNMETLEINQLLNMYLIELKYKLFEIEMSQYISPLYDSSVYQNKESLDAITYHNSLAKFKMFYVLKELAIKTNQFIKAFKTLIKTYSYEAITCQIFFDFLCENLSNQNLDEHELHDWFRDNFEKAGINKIFCEVIPMKKRPKKIESFTIYQQDICLLNRINPLCRRHTTDVLILNSDMQTTYHFDVLLMSTSENPFLELKSKSIPTVTILNASENGYFISSFTLDEQQTLLNNLRSINEIVRLKLFKQLCYEQAYLLYLDYASDLVFIENNYVFLEWVLKSCANMIESVFPSKNYKKLNSLIVEEAEKIKYIYFENMSKRIIEQRNQRDSLIVDLLAIYLPHFMCSDFKKARGILGMFKPLCSPDSQQLAEQIINNLLFRYFVFDNVDIGDKKSLISFVVKTPELSSVVKEAPLIALCDKVCERIYTLGKNFVFDDIYKLILKYNRVTVSHEEYAFLLSNIKELCTARVDEALIVDVFPLNYITQNEAKIQELTKNLLQDLEEKGMFDYSTIIKEQYEKMNKVHANYTQAHQAILQPPAQ